MNWTVLVPIIAAYGLPFAEKLWKLVMAGSTPTQAEWDELKELAKLRSVDQMRNVLQTLGIPEDSDQGQALLRLATTTI